MNAIKTKAVVEDANHLKLENKLDFVKGTQVEVLVLNKGQKPVENWKQVLDQIGVYNDEDLAGFYESRKEFNKWKPIEF